MIDDENLKRQLRAAFPPTGASEPTRDLWPLIVNRSRAATGLSWLDVNLGIVVIITLLMFPDLLLLLTYSL